MTVMNCEEASPQKDEVVSRLFVTHFVLFGRKKSGTIRHEKLIIATVSAREVIDK
jgi:hypothetical protein